MKSLNDSCYVGPDKNPRVIQDSDPMKNIAYKYALDNYESKVQRQRAVNEQFMRSHYDSIAASKVDHEAKESQRKAQIENNHHAVREQMEARAAIKAENKVLEKQYAKTSFGPEETESAAMIKQNVSRNKVLATREEL